MNYLLRVRFLKKKVSKLSKNNWRILMNGIRLVLFDNFKNAAAWEVLKVMWRTFSQKEVIEWGQKILV